MGLLRKPSDSDSINLKINEEPSKIQDIVKSTEQVFNNKIPINAKMQNDAYKGLLIYVEGYPVTVQYYKKLDSYIDKQTTEIIIPVHWSDVVGRAYDLIQNMPMKLESEINLDVDSENTEIELSGTGTVYPGVDPHVGDLFLMNINENYVGVFVVNNVVPLSYHADSFYRIDFNLYKILTQELMSVLEQVTINKYTFDKDTYFDHNYAILKSDSYNIIEKINKMIKSYTDDLLTDHYNEDINSLLRYDIIDDVQFEIYDPLIIEFFNIINTEKIKFLSQLLPTYIDHVFKKSILYKILKFDEVLNKIKLQYEVICKLYPYQFDMNLNSLVDRHIVLNVESVTQYKSDSMYASRFPSYRYLTEDDVLDTYIFTEDFYKWVNNDSTFDINNITEFENILISVLNNEYTDDIQTLIQDKLLDRTSEINIGNMNDIYFTILTIYILKKYKLWLIDNN